MKYKIIGGVLGALLLIPIGYVLAQALMPLASAYAKLIGTLLLVTFVAAMVGLLRILFAYGRLAGARARQAEITTMQNGHLIHVDDVTLLAGRLLPHTLDRHYDVEERRAAMPPNITHWHHEVHGGGADDLGPLLGGLLAIEPPPPPPQLVGPLDLPSAIARGLSTPDSWLVGTDASGQPQRAELKHTGMIAISGVPGTGKTSTAAWLAAQTAAHGGALFVADPHHGDPESLSARIAPFDGAIAHIATTPAEINALILRVARVYDWRCAKPGVASTPILLLVDEFMQLMLRKQLSDEAERALAVLSGGGRKKDVFGALISQNWSATAMGQRVTVIRQIVTGALVHQSDEETAKFLLPRGYASEATTLATGEALWFGAGTPVLVTVPYLSEADARFAGQQHPRRLAATPVAPPAAPLAPTERVASPPPAPAPPTAPLPAPTNADQIRDLLRVRPWLTSTEIAELTGIDVRVVRTTLTPLERTKEITRRPAQRPVAERYEYALNQSTVNQAAAAAISA